MTDQHDRGDAHAHDHTKGASGKMLVWALALTSIFLIAELVGAWAFGSLALLSDAAHMFTDAAALAIALAAIKIGERPADDKRTFGYRRFEILAAAFNAVLLFIVAGYILVEGLQRILNPEPVASVGMLVIAVVGLVVNLIAMRLLASGKEQSLNVKGAYLEVWADMLGSVGVIAGSVIIMVTGWPWVDPVIAIAIGLWVLPRTWTLLRKTTHILLEGVPRGIALGTVRKALVQIEGVTGVHDLHIWGISGDDANLTAHVTVAADADHDAVRGAASQALSRRFGIAHVTLQTESRACGEEPHLHP